MPAFATRSVNPYLQTQVQSRTPLELVVLLYDGALRFCTEARDAITHKDVAKRGRAISRAMAIVSELHCTLDMEAGGEVAQSLDKLYGFVRDRLIDASIRQDARSIDEAMRVLTTLREGWVGISAGPQAVK
jgi:flagellar protein FliS